MKAGKKRDDCNGIVKERIIPGIHNHRGPYTLRSGKHLLKSNFSLVDKGVSDEEKTEPQGDFAWLKVNISRNNSAAV